MENPNEYDDEAYTRASIALHRGVGMLWEAGASLQNIEEDVQSALENEGVDVYVAIDTK